MTSNENLLLVAMEECAEVQKAISKLMRFGDDGFAVVEEFYELFGVIKLCQTKGLLPNLTGKDELNLMTDKVNRVNHYLEVSKELGLVKDTEEEK